MGLVPTQDMEHLGSWTSAPSCLLIVSKQQARALPHVILAIPTSLGNIFKLSVACVLKECDHFQREDLKHGPACCLRDSRLGKDLGAENGKN